MSIDDAMNVCLKNAVKVFPVFDTKYKKWKIAARVNGRKRESKEHVAQSKLCLRMAETYKYYANKIVNAEA